MMRKGMVAERPEASRTLPDRVALLAWLILALSLPYEWQTPLLTIGPVAITSVELLAWLALAASALPVWRAWRAGKRPIPRTWLVLWAVWAAVLVLSAALAPFLAGNALKAAARTLFGLALAIATPFVIRRRQDGLAIGAALVAGGVLAGALGLVEIYTDRALPVLSGFRQTLTSAGPFLRLSGPFNYANQAAMYFEATLPLLLVLAHLAWRRRRGVAVLLIVALLVYIEAAILTYSRTSIATLLLVGVGMAVLLRWPGRPVDRPPARLWAGLALAVVTLVALTLLVSPGLRLRFQSEGDNEWYAARIEAPAQLSGVAGQPIDVTLTLYNDGLLTWSSESAQPVLLGGLWWNLTTGRRLSSETRWPLDRPVSPGETATVRLPLMTPSEPGWYRFEWDLIQENVVWFSAKNGLRTETDIRVTRADPDQQAEWVPETRPANSENVRSLKEALIPGRRVLWRVAIDMWRERPWLGIGLDNFRLTYGAELGNTLWNDTIHTNNWYLETLVSFGLAGAVPFFLWLLLLVFDIVRRVREPGLHAWQLGVAAGLAAFMIHGLLDYFLLFNATGFLFWLLVGLWLVPGDT